MCTETANDALTDSAAARSSDAREAASFSREATVSLWRGLNTSLDEVFYDVGALTSDEKSELSSYLTPEGTVLVVHPRGSSKRIESLMPWEFVEQQKTESRYAVDALVVAGVGSSALGSAALARNVADYLHRPVAAVVSGFGLSDVLSEALGGWFVLGARNAMRDSLARWFDACELKDHVRDETSHREMKQHFEAIGIDGDFFIFGSPDSATLLYLISKLGSEIKLVVGHSKGNLSIENALEGLLASCRKTGALIPSDLCILTLGAVTRFPSAFRNVHQFIGSLDYFGLMNSRPLVERTWMPNDWHSLNTALPGHLPVHEALRISVAQ